MQSQEDIVSRVFKEAQTLNTMVDQLMTSRKITHQQYQHLSQLVLADGSVDDQELHQINRLFDAIQTGQIKVLD